MVLAHIALGVAELVGEDERLAILAQRGAPILVDGMDRHGEEAEIHRGSPDSSSVMPGHSPSKTGVNALMAGHPRLFSPAAWKTWMAGTSPAMTNTDVFTSCNVAPRAIL